MSGNVWMVRAGRGGYLAEEFARGYVAIGWEELGDLSSVHTQEEIRERYLKAYPDEAPGKMPNAVAMVHKFRPLVRIYWPAE